MRNLSPSHCFRKQGSGMSLINRIGGSMKVYPRSSWTSIVPRVSTVGDQFVGLPYFSSPPERIEFHPVGKDRLYVYRNPATELNLLLKEAVLGTGSE